ncbi:o-succinylbenzoate synthase [Halobacillus rhizosphaerae]|uniref:o-succinylbenzoate synthase n=1 Tax=Halobacillus rhizosphaerae TaxID=3064889 RepID=UPI00398B7A14
MNVKQVTLHLAELPMRTSFVTHQGTITNRELIIIEAEDEQGRKGWGEVSAFSTPFYTSETVKTAWHVIVDILLPNLKFKDLTHPRELVDKFSYVKGHPMAKAGLEGAVWDLYGKQQGKSLKELIGGVRNSVKAGAVLSLSDHLAEDISYLKSSGYQRYKLKVERGKEKELVKRVQEIDPGLPLMIDANGAYSEKDIPYLKSLDTLGLLMIEQPFQAGDFYLHRKLQSQLTTPLCMDESIASFHDAKQAIELGSCRVLNIKISRVGGLTAALAIHDLSRESGIPVWCGGMVESGISKAHNLALSSLENFSIPGDLSSSCRYFYKDIVTPSIQVENGEIDVPSGPGIGVEVNEEFLRSLSTSNYVKSYQ